jgi:hypothetical protein
MGRQQRWDRRSPASLPGISKFNPRRALFTRSGLGWTCR